MNDADADHGPTWPWYSARACHVYRFLKSSWVLTLKEGLLIRPESCTLAPESLKISKRYWNATVSVRNFRVAGLAVNTGVSLTCWSFTGEIGVGAVVFKEDPS